MSTPSPTDDHAQLQGWLDQVALFCAEHCGIPPRAGRILGWLMICDPPEQTISDIKTVIDAGTPALHNNLRPLLASTLVRRHTRPGQRPAYYHADRDLWPKIIRQRIARLGAFRSIADEGIRLVGTNTPRAHLLRAAQDVFDRVAEQTAWITLSDPQRPVVHSTNPSAARPIPAVR
jgi:hypothetical protein